jgi:hypothetical protein
MVHTWYIPQNHRLVCVYYVAVLKGRKIPRSTYPIPIGNGMNRIEHAHAAHSAPGRTIMFEYVNQALDWYLLYRARYIEHIQYVQAAISQQHDSTSHCMSTGTKWCSTVGIIIATTRR